jgi:hypothetical protein
VSESLERRSSEEYRKVVRESATRRRLRNTNSYRFNRLCSLLFAVKYSRT